jgi:hypothetical protein
MNSENSKFINVTTVSIGVLGVQSKPLRAMLNVETIVSVRECEHQQEPSVKSEIILHIGSGEALHYFLSDPYESIKNLLKQAVS